MNTEQYVTKFAPLVKRIAYHLMAKLPASVQVDDLIQAGVIGAVKEVHVWTDRPTNWWPQSPDIKTRPPEAPVPSYVHWNEWLGTAPARPYADKYYHPHNWRGWWDFGTGALGDMGCHIIDHPVWALNLGAPTSVEARTTLDGSFLDKNRPNFETYPIAAIITYACLIVVARRRIAARGSRFFSESEPIDFNDPFWRRWMR